MTRDEVREALNYVASVSVAMYFLAHSDPRLIEDEGLGVLDACLRLAEVEPASAAGWQLLGRVLRHLVAALEEAGDVKAVLLRELHASVMGRVDRAATVRPNGGD
jgi:hypothetical protein